MRTPERERRVKQLLEGNVYCLQNEIVEFFLKGEEIDYSDIRHVYYTPEGSEADELEAHEIFQWFSISEWLAGYLDVLEYPVLISETYGNWMGRKTWGQALDRDKIWDEVLEKIDSNYLKAIGEG